MKNRQWDLGSSYQTECDPGPKMHHFTYYGMVVGLTGNPAHPEALEGWSYFVILNDSEESTIPKNNL